MPHYNKRLIFLLIKISLLICSFIYISIKFSATTTSDEFQLNISSLNYPYLIFSLLLIFVNWGLEATKWKFLLAKFESISYSLALKSILAGVSISIFTPNRIGEFATRVFFLTKMSKKKAALISLLGSILQLAVTITIGILGYLFYKNKSTHSHNSLNFINVQELVLACLILLFTASFIYFYLKQKRSPQLLKVLITLKSFNIKEIITASLLSFFRYAVFSFQFFLILKGLGFNANPIDVFCMIALTFLVTSAIPTFALTEIAVRSAASIYFIGILSPQPVIITTASILLWIFNLVIPAIIGAIFFFKMDFLQQKK